MRLVTPLGESQADEVNKAVRVNVVAGGGAVGASTVTDRSGTITLGGTAQQLAAANANRKGFDFYNVSNDIQWVDVTGATAVQDSPSIPFLPGAFRLWDAAIPSNSMSIVGPTTGAKFVSKEYG